MPERTYTLELTASELSATIEAFNVANGVEDGRPPLKTRSPLQRFAPPGGMFRRVDGAGSSAWRKFVDAEAGRAAPRETQRPTGDDDAR